ncbi:OmpP1/FadL family transporter [Algivirga pacifica]|uniref:Outer membrane protein transport protein n=1 Tax=Algivirga pacifica TaxID=1162670 RepID=A0ABP9DKN7_9BACT
MRIRYLVFMVLLGLPLAGWSNGFQVNLQGTRQQGRGNVGYGFRPDASSVFYNPGAMGFLSGSQAVIGGSLIFSNTVFSPLSDADLGIYTDQVYSTDNPLGTPFFAYGVFKPQETSSLSNFTFGVGVFTPFGSSVDWGEDWYGQYALQEISLEAIYIRPAVSYQITESLGIGLTLDFILGGAEVTRGLPINSATVNDPNVNLDGNADVAISFSAGVYFQPSDQWSFGLNYRHGVDVSIVKGDVDLEVPEQLSPLFQGTTFDATLPLPSVIGGGIGYYPTDRLSLGVDVSFITWSDYEELRFDFDAPIGGELSSVSERNYKNSWIFNIGGEYKVTDAFTATAGMYYDLSPVEDGFMSPETPDSDAFGFTAGVAYQVTEKIGINGSFLFLTKRERENIVPSGVETGGVSGTYKSNGFIPSIAVQYSF